jgi:hypothetical protein
MGVNDELDPEVRRFLAERIDAIELLEVLLALRAGREAAHATEALSRALGSSPRSIEGRLAALAAIGLARRDDAGWRYAPADAARDDLIARVERAYRERRLTVINLIYAPKPNDLQAFSDAFRLRPPKNREDGP